MQRIAINGCSGSGKTTLARRLGDLLDLPHTEIDGLFHGPGWVPRPSFVTDVTAVVAGDRWVIEFQYDAVRPLILERAEVMVWLDLPRWLTTWRVSRRTLSRRLRRTPLWNGNREGPLWRILVDDEHIIRWAWRSHPEAARRIRWIQTERPDLPVVRLRSGRQVRDWLDSVEDHCNAIRTTRSVTEGSSPPST